MSLKRICQELAEGHHLPVEVVHLLALRIFESIEQRTTQEGRCVIRPFGVFKLVTVRERIARDVSRNLAVVVPAHQKLTFTHGRGLKRSLLARGAASSAITTMEASSDCPPDALQNLEPGLGCAKPHTATTRRKET